MRDSQVFPPARVCVLLPFPAIRCQCEQTRVPAVHVDTVELTVCGPCCPPLTPVASVGGTEMLFSGLLQK